MKYKEVKEYYESGQLKCQYYEGKNGDECGECREYHENGQLEWQYLKRSGTAFGEVKSLDGDGTLYHHYLMDDEGGEIATVIEFGEPDTHSEEQLIEIAKEHNLPLLSDLPKTEAERTHWHLKFPDLPCLPIESK